MTTTKGRDPSATMAPCEVMIVGAGPVGLATAIELGQRGIAVRIIDLTDDVGFRPRAKLTNVRSMGLMRRWGLAEAVRAAAPLPADYPSNVIFATGLAGHTLARFENAFRCARTRDDQFPESAQWIPQYALTRVLRDHVRTLPTVRLDYGMRFTGLNQDSDGVTVQVEPAAGGSATAQRCRYLIGADGAGSSVRKAVGIRMQGDHGYARNFGVIFRAPEMWSRINLGHGIQYWLTNPACPGIVGPMERDLWFFGIQVPPHADINQLDPVDLVRRSTGLDIDVEVVATDPWDCHRLVAERYREGSVLLVGDACHLHPPMGGYGMNMGIGDALAAGWKVAALLQGWGGPALLDGYQIERRQVHERVIAEAVENYSVVTNQLIRENLLADGAAGDEARAAVGEEIQRVKVREFNTLGVVLGCRYPTSPLIANDGSAPPQDEYRVYHPSAHPGCLAPHHWMPDQSSLYDHFGRGFTLLTEREDQDVAAFAQAAEARGLPFKVLAHGDPALTALYQARLALVRPDQFVAWRGNAAPSGVGALLDQARGA